MFIVACALSYALVSCDGDFVAVPSKQIESTEPTYVIDYYTAEAFESAINSGASVQGKIVQFYVDAYRPDSILGFNCYAGDHLNFISENDVNVVAGNFIIGRVTEEPWKVFGSWDISFEVLEIRETEIQDSNEVDNEKPSQQTTKPTETIEPTESATVSKVKTVEMGEDSSSYIGRQKTEVETIFRELGFKYIKLTEKVTTDTGVTDGTVATVTIKSTGFKKGDLFAINEEVVISYWKVEEPKMEVVLPKEGTKLAKDYDFTSDYDGKTVYYINVDGQKNVPKLVKWKNTTVTDGVKEYLEYLEKLGFAITVTNALHREPYQGFHYYEIEFKASKGNFSWTMYLAIQDEAYAEYEFHINAN